MSVRGKCCFCGNQPDKLKLDRHDKILWAFCFICFYELSKILLQGGKI